MKKKDMWPPGQLHFTPPLIVHYLEHANVAFYESSTKVKAAGGAKVIAESEEIFSVDHR